MLKRSRIRSISSSCSDPTSLGCRGRTDADALGAWACPAVTALAASARPAMSDGAAAATSVFPPSRSASLYLSPPSCPIHPALGPFSHPFVHTVRAGLVGRDAESRDAEPDAGRGGGRTANCTGGMREPAAHHLHCAYRYRCIPIPTGRRGVQGLGVAHQRHCACMNYHGCITTRERVRIPHARAYGAQGARFSE